MTSTQRVIKYIALALSLLICLGILKGMISVIGYIAPYFENQSSEEVSEKETEYTFETDTENLIIDIRSAQLTVKTGNSFKMDTNYNTVKYKYTQNALKIYEEKQDKYNKNLSVELTIPENTPFKEIEISTGAGAVKINALSADTLDIEIGAGEFTAEKINAFNSIDISSGAGSITIHDGIMNNADFDLGAGEFNLTGSLIGKSSIECGIGEANLNLMGSLDDYSIRFEKGIGESKINGEKAMNDKIYGNGTDEIDIEGGIGELNVSFHSNSAIKTV